MTASATPPTPLTEYQRHLVETHIGLARSLAFKMWHKSLQALEIDDTISAAYQGLVSAAQRFDVDYRPSEDPDYDPFLAFGSFAKIRINGAIQDWMRALDHVPRRHRSLYRSAEKLDEPGRTPEDIAALLGVEPERVRAVRAAVLRPPVSLDRLELARGEAEEKWVQSSVRSSEDIESSFTATAVQQAVAAAVEEMPDFEKSVIVLRYYCGYDFPQIATELGSSRSRVKEVHQEAVVVLHRLMMGIVA